MTEQVRVGPGRFRWRLTFAFVLVAAISAGIVAAGSFLLIRQGRYESFIERSLSTAGLATSLAETVPPGLDLAEELVTRLDRQGRFEVVAVTTTDSVTSDPRIDPESTPDLGNGPVEGHRYGDTDVDGEHFLVVSPEAEIDARLYFYFSRANIDAELGRLKGALVQSSLMVLFLAGFAGYLVSRQTLRPVGRASVAAQALAEGLLETRLPVERHDEFGAWAVSFNEMADALQEKIEALTEARERERRFTSDVAHELRTPLTALVTSASILRSELGTLDPDARWAAERLLDQVTRLRDLVEEILEVSRLESGQLSVSLIDIEPQRFFAALLRNRHWEDRVEIESRVDRFRTDPRRLERIVGNLIDNAIDHGGGRAAVTVTGDDGVVRIEVGDSGPGIDQAHLEMLFDRFYKADPARRGGSGLGLAIARENARLLGGDIAVETGPASGSTFIVTLPRSPS